MRYIKFITVFLSLAFVIACASLSGVEDQVEKVENQIKNVNPENNKKMVEKKVETISANGFDSIQQMVTGSNENKAPVMMESSVDPTAETTNSSSPSPASTSNATTPSDASITNSSSTTPPPVTLIYNQQYTDSLRQQLIENGQVTIKGYESILLQDVLPEEVVDTIYLANLFAQTQKKGIPISFQYNVQKNDLIMFEFENMKSKKIQKIELIEGGETRFVRSNLKKKEQIQGSFKIQADNTLTLNIVKQWFFKSVIKIKITKLPQKKQLTIEQVTDTITEVKTIVEKVADTLFSPTQDKLYNLKPVLEISSAHRISFPIEISDVQNLIGWGYWIGLNKKEYEKYQQLEENDPNGNPLITFAKAELEKKKPQTFLPKTNNTDVRMEFKTLVPDTLSLNSGSNFAFFKSDSLAASTKANFMLTNTSKLNDYDIYVKVVTVNLEFSKQEIEKEFYTPQTLLNLQYK